VQVTAAAEQSQSVSWSDGIKRCLNKVFSFVFLDTLCVNVFVVVSTSAGDCLEKLVPQNDLAGMYPQLLGARSL